MMKQPPPASVLPRTFKAGGALICLLGAAAVPPGGDFETLCADRTAVERVYYHHRTGTKPPFDQALPRASLERMVRREMKQEAVLRDRYAVAITPALLDGEVQRINTSTRAPEMLAEIKAALGNDPARFAHSFAKAILVERLLREKFENDDALHAAGRRQCEALRNHVLSAKASGAAPAQLVAQLQRLGSNRVMQATWRLTPRPADSHETPADPARIRAQSGPEASALSQPFGADTDPQHYFDDLPEPLQEVLKAQLRQAGDISAVIETPASFLLYLAREKNDSVLIAACLALPKRGFDHWLDGQPDPKP